MPFPGFLPQSVPDGKGGGAAGTPSAASSASQGAAATKPTPGSGGLLAATSVFIRSLSPFATAPAAGAVPVVDVPAPALACEACTTCR